MKEKKGPRPAQINWTPIPRVEAAIEKFCDEAEVFSGLRPSRHDALSVFADLGVTAWEQKKALKLKDEQVGLS